VNYRGIVVGGVKIVLLALAVLNILHIFAQSPVMNAGLRMPGVAGDWRTDGVGFVYERSVYFRERAVEFLVAAAEADPESVGEEERFALLDAALEAATRSVAAAPADASAWLLLAWTQSLLGEEAAAMDALARSWQLAPNSLALALDRVVIAETLALGAETAPAIAAAVRRDVEILEASGGRPWATARQAAPGIVDRFAPAEEST